VLKSLRRCSASPRDVKGVDDESNASSDDEDDQVQRMIRCKNLGEEVIESNLDDDVWIWAVLEFTDALFAASKAQSDDDDEDAIHCLLF